VRRLRRRDDDAREGAGEQEPILYELAEMSPKDKTVLDIGCGWGSNLEYVAKRGVKAAHGVTLSHGPDRVSVHAHVTWTA
jgi:2-polyprenyl-3-methyl-5-hydroxy-6-metoxy-1,4-benzoquinol methylase